MTPKEKAIELIKSFYPHVQWKLGQEDCLDRAKQCSSIALNEMIKVAVDYSDYDETVTKKYLREVKKEILNLKKL